MWFAILLSVGAVAIGLFFGLRHLCNGNAAFKLTAIVS